LADLKPIYVLADSQLLFWEHEGRRFVERLRTELTSEMPTAAYIGASSGDDPRFFELFCAAMAGARITQCNMISSCFGADDRAVLNEADVILLSGGDFERGWKIIDAVGLKETVVERYLAGALLIGVSAGAVHLGVGAFASRASNHFVHTLRLVPFLIGTHEERDGWLTLSRAVEYLDGDAQAIGVPAGGGFIYHSDHVVEPVRKDLHEIVYVEGELRSRLLSRGPDQ